MNRIPIALAALLAMASTAAAQRPTVVYTNVTDDGRRINRIVKVVRVTMPAAPVPTSIVTTPTPVGWTPEIGGSSYAPPRPTATVHLRPRRPVRQPLYVNGIYVGPSPNGLWTATSIGRPIVDVNIVSRRRTR
jgi:hypothetical protein